VKKKNRKKSWEIWQTHHLEYEPEIITRVTRTEHFFLGRLDTYFKARGISRGMKIAFRHMAKKYRVNMEPRRKE